MRLEGKHEHHEHTTHLKSKADASEPGSARDASSRVDMAWVEKALPPRPAAECPLPETHRMRKHVRVGLRRCGLRFQSAGPALRSAAAVSAFRARGPPWAQPLPVSGARAARARLPGPCPPLHPYALEGGFVWRRFSLSHSR